MNSLSVVIPIFEERKNIIKLINGIKKNIKIKKYEIIFVDDNSKDGTEEILKKIKKKNKKIKYFIRKEKTKDLSKSCMVGFNISKYKNILVMDGDLQHDPKDIKKLILNFKKKDADIVVGSRNLFRSKKNCMGHPFYRILASKIFILTISFLFGKKTDDPMSGFFIFKKTIYTKNKKKLYGKGYKILFDLLCSTDKKLKIVDVDINFRARSIGTSKMNLKILYILVLFIIKRNFTKYAL